MYHKRIESPLTGHTVFLYDNTEIYIFGWLRDDDSPESSPESLAIRYEDLIEEYHKLQPDDFKYTNTLKAVDKDGKKLLVHISDIVGYDNLPA